MSEQEMNFYESLHELQIEAIDKGSDPLLRQALFQLTAEMVGGLTNSASVYSLLDSFRTLVLTHHEGASQFQGSK